MILERGKRGLISCYNDDTHREGFGETRGLKLPSTTPEGWVWELVSRTEGMRTHVAYYLTYGEGLDGGDRRRPQR